MWLSSRLPGILNLVTLLICSLLLVGLWASSTCLFLLSLSCSYSFPFALGHYILTLNSIFFCGRYSSIRFPATSYSTLCLPSAPTACASCVSPASLLGKSNHSSSHSPSFNCGFLIFLLILSGLSYKIFTLAKLHASDKQGAALPLYWLLFHGVSFSLKLLLHNQQYNTYSLKSS